VNSHAVILAAGTGERLRPLTDTTPKCLLEVGGRPLLGRLLDALADAGVGDAVIVTGHLAEHIETFLVKTPPALAVRCVRNSAYATTNNAVSLAAARPALGDDAFVLCDGDVVFSSNPVPALLAAAGPCVLAIDADAAYDAEAMKVELGADGRVMRISKRLLSTASAGESIGIQHIGGDGVARLWDTLAALVRQRADAYYEDAFQEMIDGGVRFTVSPIAPESCLEIDDAADLAAARRRFGP
jgi:choline kinase